MQEPHRLQDTTLNNNITKELIWRRNSPYFYQTLYTQELEWPSLSVEWWVDQYSSASKTSKKDEYQLCHLTYGTYTNGGQNNYLVLAKVYLPNQQSLKKTQKSSKPSETIKKNDNTMEDKIQVLFEVQHDGELNRIKHHPKKTNLIATRTPLGEIHIYDKVRFKTKRSAVAPSIILTGHETEGYSIEWNPHKQGSIIAGSYDSKLTLWDITSKEQNNRIKPLCYFNFHNKEIEQVSHNQFHDCIFASCDDQGQVVIWDTRNAKQPVHYFNADSLPLYSVQFATHNRHIFATGGEEKLVKLWDLRNMSTPVVSMADLDNKQIKQLKWSHKNPQHLWVTAGRNITMWDLDQQKPKFVHSGHMQDVNQMDLHPDQHNTVASVDQNNQLHIFQPPHNLFA